MADSDLEPLALVTPGGGGGSGGSLILVTNELSGSEQAVICARGGAGASVGGGAGGGGRMFVRWGSEPNAAQYFGRVDVTGGDPSAAKGSKGGDGTAQSEPPCQPGHGGFLCEQCKPGYVNGPNLNNSVCTPCPAGFVARSAGLTSCIECENGTMSSAPGSSECAYVCDLKPSHIVPQTSTVSLMTP